MLLQFLVVGDLARLELPGGRRARIVFAQIAGRIDAAAQLHAVAVECAAPYWRRGASGRTAASAHLWANALFIESRNSMKSAKMTSPVGVIRLTWPGCGDRVGALVVGDGIGQQDLAPCEISTWPLATVSASCSSYWTSSAWKAIGALRPAAGRRFQQVRRRLRPRSDRPQQRRQHRGGSRAPAIGLPGRGKPVIRRVSRVLQSVVVRPAH